LKVHFLAPLISVNNDDSKDSRDENDWSLAVILSTQNGHVWAFGDAPKDLEMDIMELNPTLPTGGLLLVPHHGSDTSSSEELLDGLKPDVAVVSHKRPLPNRVMERYRKRHIPMCGTSPGGTVHLRLRKGRIWIPMGCFVP
jgi:competence protein ComEC